MGFDYNAFNAARPGTRPSRPGGQYATKKTCCSSSVSRPGRPGGEKAPGKAGRKSIGDCLAYGKNKKPFDYNAHHAARPGTRPSRPGA